VFSSLCNRLAVVSVMLLSASAHADVFNMGGTRNPTTGTWTGLASLDFVTVGNPGNAADTANGSLYGSVPYTYQMGKYDVTVGQYCQFLNAVAKTDTYGLYNTRMSNDMPTITIARSGSSGNYAYAVTGRLQRLHSSRQLSDVRRYVGRCRTVLQLAAKRPTDCGAGNGHNRDRGIYA